MVVEGVICVRIVLRFRVLMMVIMRWTVMHVGAVGRLIVHGRLTVSTVLPWLKVLEEL